MIKSKLKNKGYTLIEIIMVLFIISFVLGITIFSFNSLKNRQSLDKQVDFVKSLIKEARYSALNSKNGQNQKIIFSTSSITLNDKKFDFENNVKLKSYSTGTNTITFYRITGLASATGTIEYTILDGNKDLATTSIVINALGIIE